MHDTCLHLFPNVVVQCSLVYRGQNGGIVVHGGAEWRIKHAPRPPRWHGAIVILHLRLLLILVATTCEN